MNGRRVKYVVFAAVSGLVAPFFSGCMTRASAEAQAQAAYVAGQHATLKARQAQGLECVTVIGPVGNPQVPWVVGLTLAQAIATAQYVGLEAPREIIITRQGETATMDAKDLLNGADIPLEAGDIIQLK